MTLTFAAALASAGIDPADALVIRHAYVPTILRLTARRFRASYRTIRGADDS